MSDERVARHRVGDVEGYVCERCDAHQTMVELDDARAWKPIEGGYYASVDGPFHPPLAPTLYRCKHCGWETTTPRRDTGPWAEQA